MHVDVNETLIKMYSIFISHIKSTKCEGYENKKKNVILKP